MIILGIETSTSVCSVGLADDNGARGELSLIESRIHSEKILTLIQSLCKNNNIELDKLEGIAISIGPGSFTGLRIGMSTAKGFCYSLEKSLLAVPTFDAVAKSFFNFRPEEKRAAIIVDAKQGQFYQAVYERKGRLIIPIIFPKIESIFPLEELNYKETVVITDNTDKIKEQGINHNRIEEITNYCRGDFVAEIGVQKLKAKDISDLEMLEPLYLKDFIVKTNCAIPKS